MENDDARDGEPEEESRGGLTIRIPRFVLVAVLALLLAGGGVAAYLALHETEAWVLAAAAELAELVESPTPADTLRSHVTAAGGPELVNDGPDTAPSKRIQRAHPTYRKVVDGPDAIELLGLTALRTRCPHLDKWLNHVEGGTTLGA